MNGDKYVNCTFLFPLSLFSIFVRAFLSLLWNFWVLMLLWICILKRKTMMQTEPRNINAVLIVHKKYRFNFYLAIESLYFLWHLIVKKINGKKPVHSFFSQECFQRANLWFKICTRTNENYNLPRFTAPWQRPQVSGKSCLIFNVSKCTFQFWKTRRMFRKVLIPKEFKYAQNVKLRKHVWSLSEHTIYS